jgi:tetratricopeptide (TPR) repeat protein
MKNTTDTSKEMDQQALLQQELAEKIATLEQDPRSIVTSLNNLGTAYDKLGNHELGLQYQQQALELDKELLGQEYPD